MTKICGLKVEGMESPMGIGEARPRFSWQVADAAPGFLQRAYALELASDDGTFHWESGTVSSAESVLVEGCPRLAPRRRFRWRVTLYAEGEEKGISSEWSWFETGKLNEHWK